MHLFCTELSSIWAGTSLDELWSSEDLGFRVTGKQQGSHSEFYLHDLMEAWCWPLSLTHAVPSTFRRWLSSSPWWEESAGVLHASPLPTMSRFVLQGFL